MKTFSQELASVMVNLTNSNRVMYHQKQILLAVERQLSAISTAKSDISPITTQTSSPNEKVKSEVVNPTLTATSSINFTPTLGASNII